MCCFVIHLISHILLGHLLVFWVFKTSLCEFCGFMTLVLRTTGIHDWFSGLLFYANWSLD